MKIINASDLKLYIMRHLFIDEDSTTEEIECQILRAIDVQPAIEAKVIKHGHWIVKKTSAGTAYTICSHCNASVKYNDEYGTVVMNLAGANYCPNCGAKMDEVSE